jgi:NADP-dependent 3-hydroxy acid dehydrogenase YdfG
MALNPKVESWKDRRIWIVGASTGIGAALAEDLLAKGAKVAVSARKREPLEAMAAKHGGNVAVLPLDINDAPALAAATQQIVALWGGLDLLVLMAGDYAPMRAYELDLEVARRMIQTNIQGYLNALAPVIPLMMKQASGTLCLVSSVAGFRGLPKSLIYGPTKAAIINLAETMYMDLSDKGIGVCVVNPGFVRTPLTAGNEFKMPALIEPDEAAREIVAGLEKGHFEIHFPKRFTGWLKLMRHLPYTLYFPAIRKMTGL